METTVTIPDALFARAEAVAARHGLTRGELITLALEAYIDTQDGSTSVAAINRVCADLDTALSSDLVHNARQHLREVEW